MSRGALVLISLLMTTAGLSGCGNGEYVPLIAPGGSDEWPIDPGWSSPASLLQGEYLIDGVWNHQATAGSPQVVLVGTGGVILENIAGDWTTRYSGDGYSLSSIVQAPAGEFVAVGSGGRAFSRASNAGAGEEWLREETGTDESLALALADGDRIWAVGSNGTVVRRESGAWTTLPSSGDFHLVAAAVLNDSLFVVDYLGNVRIWDNQSNENQIWGDMPDGPWLAGEVLDPDDHGVLGLATIGDGHLYAFADSVYVREPTGWRTITDTSLDSRSSLNTRVVGQTIWYGRSGSWWHIDPTVAPWQPEQHVAYSNSIMAIGDELNYLASSSYATMTWTEDGEQRRDIAGNLSIYGHIRLDEGGMLLYTDVGVVHRSAAGAHLLMDVARVPLLGSYTFEAGCGISPEDYYLVGREALYHCVGGQAQLMGTWTESLGFDTAALSGAGELYAGGDEGLYHWQGTSWQRIMPLLEDESRQFKVWSLGDGRLGAVDRGGVLYCLEDGPWRAIGQYDWEVNLLAGEDGSLFAVARVNQDGSYSSTNVLLEYDSHAGAFREPQQQGMGPLADLRIDGSTSRDGEVLIWTTAPAMVFTLKGPPSRGDWHVVAGPLDMDIRMLERLPDGNLLAWVSEIQDFAIYRP